MRRGRSARAAPSPWPGTGSDHGHLTGYVGKQSGRALQRVLQADGSGQERRDSLALRVGEGDDGGQAVHEVPVALLRRDAARGRVGLDEIPLFLEGTPCRCGWFAELTPRSCFFVRAADPIGSWDRM